MRSRYTRTGTLRSGLDYQDLVALQVLVEMLEHPDRYRWVRVEADDAGSLDDVVCLRSDGSFDLIQVKCSTSSESVGGILTWEKLLDKGGKTAEFPSLLEKWSSSLELWDQKAQIHDARVETNRRPADEIGMVLSPGGLVDFEKIGAVKTRAAIAEQLGGESKAKAFFARFRFWLDRPGIDQLEVSVQKRFLDLGGTLEGWWRLKDELRRWARNRNQPPPDGAITLQEVMKAADWHRLESLPQEFEVPKDYVRPPRDFHECFLEALLALRKGCMVLTGRPGSGKSTYLSYLVGELGKQGIPVVRHHYFLSFSDRTSGRLDYRPIAESLISDIQKSFPKALGEIGNRNPNPGELSKWVDACGQHFAVQGMALIIVIDGLDHVWRESGSRGELDRLFERLLPAPEGVVVLVGTQPLGDTQVPLRLMREAPRNRWRELPLLDRSAVTQWVALHDKDLNLPEDQISRAFRLDQLADAFFKKSQGHPLHLVYTLKALQERGLAPAEDNVEQLPGIPHQDIAKYYEELWRGLPEESREILHMFAACPFPWPETGIIDCVDPGGRKTAAVNSALRQVAHLMIRDPLGLRPFHSSLLVFVQGRDEHSVYSQRMKQSALNWLRTKAPEYWRWAYEWLLEADLGNDQPLLQGPTREWAVEAVAKGYPRHEVSEILGRSSWAALQSGDLPRFVQVGLLRDYAGVAYEIRSGVLDALLYPQLIAKEDPWLQVRLAARIDALSEPAVAALAEKAAGDGEGHVVHQWFWELNERLGEGHFTSSVGLLDDWESRVVPVLKVAALDKETDPEDVVKFAFYNRANERSCDVLETYTEALRVSRNIEPIREILKHDLTDSERSVVFKNVTLLALEDNLDLDREVSVAYSIQDPFGAIYASLRRLKSVKVGEVVFPDTELLGLTRHRIYLDSVAVQRLFYTAFFCLLANHLSRQSARNEEWLHEVGDYSWPRAFLWSLNAMVSDLAQLLLSNSPASLGWLYRQVRTFAWPRWPEERDACEYALCARKAMNEISLDVLILGNALGQKPEITTEGLEIAFTSGYCDPWDWMDAYVGRRRRWLNHETVGWLLHRQAGHLSSSIQGFSERAAKYSTLASVATLHGLLAEAKSHVRQAASNLISHGDHKDIVLFGALDLVKACSKEYPGEARQWLLGLATPIASVMRFTDGDETSHLPGELADVLSEVAPDLLPRYYEWLCEEEEYSDALKAFHSFLKRADLSDQVSQALAKTGVDDESLSILAKRGEEGNQGAEEVLSSLTGLLGQRTLERVRADDEEPGQPQYQTSGKEEPPSSADYPPDRLSDYLAALKERSCDWDECIKDWLEFWKNVGKEGEAFRAIEEREGRGEVVGGCDAVFHFALSFYGGERAYPWLVKAHVRRYGWHYFFTSKDEAVRRWEMVRKHYPGRCLRFVQDSMKSEWGEQWHGIRVYDSFVRLVEYCFFMGQPEVAKQISERVMSTVLELVSPLRLPVPGWAIE